MFALPRDGIVKPRFGNVRGDRPRGVGPVPSRMPGSSLGRFEKVLRLGEGRRVKRLAEQAAYVTSLEPDFEALSDADLRPRRPSSSNGSTTARASRTSSSRRSQPCARRASASPASALRRAADGRDRAPRGRHRRDEDRRGQDLRRERAALPQRAHRQERPPRHGQRLPRQARRRVEPARLRPAGGDRRLRSRT